MNYGYIGDFLQIFPGCVWEKRGDEWQKVAAANLKWLGLRDNSEWEQRVSPLERELEQAASRILDFLKEHPGVTEKAIIEGVEGRREIICRAFRALIKARKVERSGKGGRFDSFRYWVSGREIASEQCKINMKTKAEPA